jgi:hypothetical protein
MPTPQIAIEPQLLSVNEECARLRKQLEEAKTELDRLLKGKYKCEDCAHENVAVMSRIRICFNCCRMHDDKFVKKHG